MDGTGRVAPASAADIFWLIVPAPGASNEVPRGTLYSVGATLRYTIGSEEQVTEVKPDYIFVKPMPELTIDYFLPTDVHGDDAFTTAIEPPEPFTLRGQAQEQRSRRGQGNEDQLGPAEGQDFLGQLTLKGSLASPTSTIW